MFGEARPMGQPSLPPQALTDSSGKLQINLSIRATVPKARVCSCTFSASVNQGKMIWKGSIGTPPMPSAGTLPSSLLALNLPPQLPKRRTGARFGSSYAKKKKRSSLSGDWVGRGVGYRVMRGLEGLVELLCSLTVVV